VNTLFENIASWTNSRALIEGAKCFQSGDNFHFEPVTVCEIKIFLGLTLAMALIRKPTIDSYWYTEPLMQAAYFNSCMSRDRCKKIMKFLRFSNPYVSSDKNSRISDMDKICLEINKCFLPGKSLSLDESLLLHKGRLSFRMFIQTKRARLD